MRKILAVDTGGTSSRANWPPARSRPRKGAFSWPAAGGTGLPLRPSNESAQRLLVDIPSVVDAVEQLVVVVNLMNE